MPSKNHFRYKKGRTEIESDNDNGAAIKLAKLHLIFYWSWRFALLGLALYRILSG